MVLHPPTMSATPTLRPGQGVANRTLRRNFRLLVLHGFLGQTGFRLVQAPTFLPHFVELLAGNASAVGILRAAQSFGMFLSPLFSAGLIERRARAKGLGIVFGAALRVQVLFLAVIALAIPTEQALELIWVAVGLMGLALGMQGVAFNFVVSKTIPPELRGRLHGLRNAAAGTLLMAVGWIGGLLVESQGFPRGYGWTFALGFALTSLGLVAFALLREPDSVSPRAAGTDFAARLRELPGLLRAEPQFRRFLGARLCGTAARGAMPLYIVLVSRRLSVTGTELGIYTVAFTLANSFGGLGWGLLADRIGFKRIFQLALCVWAGGSGIAIFAGSPWGALALFIAVGAGVSGFMLSSQNLVLEFGGEGDRPMRIAISNTLSEGVGMCSFLAAGVLADQVAIEPVLIASITLQVAGVALMSRVQEPRGPRRLVAPPINGL